MKRLICIALSLCFLTLVARPAVAGVGDQFGEWGGHIRPVDKTKSSGGFQGPSEGTTKLILGGTVLAVIAAVALTVGPPLHRAIKNLERIQNKRIQDALDINSDIRPNRKSRSQRQPISQRTSSRSTTVQRGSTATVRLTALTPQSNRPAVTRSDVRRQNATRQGGQKAKAKKTQLKKTHVKKSGRR